ncbi:CBASS cGAMP-activated phospholipase [Mesobacillus zeae]|uniref:Patatin n=1 Tax=Mesobacillus zeae TaxID=1917180 RepID=A0A398B797_9BACI|nr:CBASS cGAMP-activated phospholipase [Mesobacillus zeae]RID85712.1 patatin [Mesobacillus zeae]
MKILSVDGGGVRGILPIAFLTELEKEYEKPAGEMFDIITGTSTGAIIAAALAVGIPMGELLERYMIYGKKIFSPQAHLGILKSVYSDRYLRRLLKKAFGTATLRDVNKPLLLPAVDITHGKPFVNRSNFGSRKSGALDIELWDAVLSSCSAPVYFPPNNVNGQYMTIDGGLWANNPSLVGLTEAMHEFGHTLDNISILSLGTGRQKIDFSEGPASSWGIWQWVPVPLATMKPVPKLLDLALDLTSEAVSHHCRLMLGDRYLRVNQDLGEEIPFDEPVFMEKMGVLGQNAFFENKESVSAFLF